MSAEPVLLNGRKYVVLAMEDISNRKLAESRRERALERQERLYQLQQALLGPGSLEQKLKRITDGVVDIFGVDFCRIWIAGLGDLCGLGCMHAAVTEGEHVCRQRFPAGRYLGRRSISLWHGTRLDHIRTYPRPRQKLSRRMTAVL